MNNGRVHVGIDLSLSSPGLAFYMTKTKQYYAYYYPSRKKDFTRSRVIKMEKDKVFNLCSLGKSCQEGTLVERYDRIVRDILVLISVHCPDVKLTNIRIEGYAFDALSSSASKLHELGGILKHSLWRSGYSFEEIPPTRLKKWFTGSGKATKEKMYESFVSKGFPKLIEIFEMQECKGIPCPVQDVVDGISLCDSWLTHN